MTLGESRFHPRQEAHIEPAVPSWLGAAVLGTALLAGTGIVTLIQFAPALRQALG